MSSGRKCKNCGSSDIEVDPARGDAVCTNCGSVLEDNIIVPETEFQENAHGSSSMVGQFVSAESKGGATGYGAAFSMGVSTESREVTIKKAKQGITALSQNLRLKQHCIDIACNFFKMALSRHLTQGRPASHIHAACVYITCRTEGTDHLLIDISDVLQICCYQLGRAYLQLSRALCIKIPSIDPCIYILRFANQLDFGDKTQEISTTALRLVQRMKRDSLHSGRRPSGLCGAALLLASRLHEMNREPADLVRIVKVHESTLRKRLVEFGDTPSGALTLDEFLTVDLEEEQDPPAFIAARKKDKERLKKFNEKDGEVALTQLQKEIECQLEKDHKKKTKHVPSTPKSISGCDESAVENADLDMFVLQTTCEAVNNSLNEDDPDDPIIMNSAGLGPDLESMGVIDQMSIPNVSNILGTSIDISKPSENSEANVVGESLDDIDDDEINSIIMTPREALYKTHLWHKLNAPYLKEQKLKAAVLAKEKEEGKPERKKRKVGPKRKGAIGPSSSAGEAIEKMLQEKKISTKINYDILMSLNKVAVKEDANTAPTNQPIIPSSPIIPESPSRKRKTSFDLANKPTILSSPLKAYNASRRNRNAKLSGPVGLPVMQSPQTPASVINEPQTPKQIINADDDAESEYYEEDTDVQDKNPAGEMESISQLLRSQDEDEDYVFDEY
ncbi:brf RNA polymerase III subunit [Arctopsyche grandis]|uniref:brf RNA polymerase III subunit n=1 Tax=Arctopsyche grandis TaxID=121162 RepID=UPI00406D6C8B